MNHTPAIDSEARAGFSYLLELFDRHGQLVDRETVKNLIPTEGLNHIAGVVFKSTVQVATWYIALFKGNYTPQPTDTAATVAALTTETTAYDEATRVPFAPGDVNTGALDNTAAKAEFTFNATETIYGGFVVSSAPKASTTGVLMSIVRFSSPKQVEDGSVLRITTGIAFTSA